VPINPDYRVHQDDEKIVILSHQWQLFEYPEKSGEQVDASVGRVG